MIEDDAATQTAAALQRLVDEHPSWHHVIDIAPGVATKGWLDLRPVVEQLPWPNVRGKRCLDIGTSDGFLAFELERRGAAEVVAIDVDGQDPDLSGTTGAGFRLAAELLGSTVDRRVLSIYDLDPDEIGTFDVVVCGGLLLKLRNPLRALEAVGRVTQGMFMSAEPIELWLSVFGRGKPLFSLDAGDGDGPWFSVNGAGHRRLLDTAGFAVERVSKPYTVRVDRPPTSASTWRERVTSVGTRALTGSWEPGVRHRALLCRRRD